MTIKKYFEVAENIQSLANKSAADISSEVESVGYHEQDIIEEERFIPRIDFSKPENFARYGSAEEYYAQSIKRIYNTYPYDGSLKERLEWVNESTYLDIYLYDNKYPRTTGYIIMSADGAATDSIVDGYGRPSSPEYIYVKGGPNPHPEGTAPYNIQFTGSNYYEPSMSRASNLEMNLSSNGVSLEFWLKKDGFLDPSITSREVIFDLWNGELSSSNSYGRLRLELTGNLSDGSGPFLLTAMSGTSGSFRQSIAAATVTSASVADGNWHHYAVTMKSASAGVTTRFYVDGGLNNESTLGSTGINDLDSTTLRAYVGALITSVSGATTPSSTEAGDGKLSAAMDEFRFWKTQRSSKEIGRHWFTQVGGGTNTDPQPFVETMESGNVDLGIYFKFNEGITGVAATDKVVLDYSGRFSNGAWTVASVTNSRNTGSAIVSSSAAIKEFHDPIIYSFHPDVVALDESLQLSGSFHDTSNNASVYNSIPAWITEEDNEGQKQLLHLTQIMSSYFDTLQLQIESLNTLKDKQYPSGSNKPLPFAEKLLSSQGFIAPDLFLDADILEQLADRSEDRVYEKSLHDVKNIIYQNIYNNLSYIYKSKGTEKAFRNLIRCFGIDEELIKLNTYADNIEFELKNNRKNVVVADNFVNFNTSDGAVGVVYNYADPTNINSVGAIPANIYLTGGYATTLEAEILFPLKMEQSARTFHNTNVISASLFGMHNARAATGDTTWSAPDTLNFQVYAQRDEKDSSNARFVLTSTAGGLITRLTSSLIQDLYNNNRWNLSVRIKPAEYPLRSLVVGTTDDYIVELHGVQADSGEILDEFTVSQTLTAPTEGFVTGSRRAYIGAHRQNFTGSVLETSDVKVNACRYWLDYVDDAALRGHILDTENHGALQPHLYAYEFNPSASFGDIQKIDTLVFNWEFLTNTGSNANGQFTVSDISSGSAALTRYGALGDILNKQYTASGSFFAASSTTAIDKDYVVSSKLNLPEHIESVDMIRVLNLADQEVFTSETRPQNYYFAFEKSMYQAISKEIINYFANLKDLHNLIGEPLEKYRIEYKQLKVIRQKFFETIGNNELDFDKFYEFYKWFDSSLSVMLAQLVPASADFADNIITVIENHILERPKYRRKFPFLKKEGTQDPSATIGPNDNPISINTSPDDYPAGTGLTSNEAFTRRQIGSSNPIPQREWRFFHAPAQESLPTPLVSGAAVPPEDRNLYWHRYREERINSDRTALLKSIQQTYNRRIGAPVRVTVEGQITFGGVGRHPSNRPNYTFAATAPYGPVIPSTNIPTNVMLSYGSDVEQLIDTKDVYFPTLKQRLGFGMDPGINSTPDEIKLDGNVYAPFSLYSSSVETGYNSKVVTQYKSGTMITNLHNDFVQNHDVPMQGPFAEKFVGGRHYRHTEVNDGTDTRESRAEGFRLELGSLALPATGTLGVVPPNYPFADSPPGSAPHGFLPELPTAQRFRDETAKRPVNIRNILMTTASVGTRLSGTIAHNQIGNYQKNYQVISTGGRTINDPFFQDQSFDFALYPETLATRGRFPMDLDADSTENVGGELNYELPNRTGANSNQTIIVNKFSSPGEYSTLSRGYMEPAHEELAVNNASPYRNRGVINYGISGSASVDPSIQNTIRVQDQLDKPRGLNQRATLHCGPFGTDAVYGSVTSTSTRVDGGLGYSETPSWQKTNRNRKRRIIEYREGAYLTGSVYDNLFVQHAIPQSEQQYSWITASLASGQSILGLDRAMCFSASTLSSLAATAPVGSVSINGDRVWGQDIRTGVYATHVDYSASVINLDYVGLNTIIAEPVSASSHTLGYPEQQVTLQLWPGTGGRYLYQSTYINQDIQSGYQNIASVFAPQDRADLIGDWGEGAVSINGVLNSILLNRNGPYGWPTWKQIRAGESPVARKLRETNQIGTVLAPKTIEDAFGVPVQPNFFEDYFEAPISKNASPIYFYFEDNTAESNPANNIVLTVPFRNELDYFSNNGLNNRLGLKIDLNRRRPYNSAVDFTISSSLTVIINYSERLYPSAQNAYKTAVRGRENYTIDNIWNNDRTLRSVPLGGLVGSMGQTIASSSIWPLDAHLNFAATSSISASDGAGELMNVYSRWTKDRYGNGTPAVGSMQGDEQIELHAATTYASRIPAGVDASNNIVFAGDTLWMSPIESGKNPYQDYTTYAEKARLVAKDHSIIPEFRISELMEDYITTHAGNFLANIDNIFDLTGSSIPDSSTPAFYKTYTNADFLRYFGAIDDDLNDQRSGDLKIVRDKVVLKCDAVVKFLPYKGFYPAERTKELATLLSQSYSADLLHVGGGKLDNYKFNSAAQFRIFAEPLVSPGILFNTIKSGLAVGNFVITQTGSGTANTWAAATMPYASQSAPCILPEGDIYYGRDQADARILSIAAATSGSGNGYQIKKIPFEAIYRPADYFNKSFLSQENITPWQSAIFDTGISGSQDYMLTTYRNSFTVVVTDIQGVIQFNPSPTERLVSKKNGTLSQGSLYELAIDNFLCETTNFFMGNLANLQSSRGENFGSVVSGTVYTMKMAMFRTLPSSLNPANSFEMYNRISAFGTPLASAYREPGFTSTGNVSFSHLTPAYFHSSGSTTFAYTASISGIPDLDEIFGNTNTYHTRTETHPNLNAADAVKMGTEDPRMYIDSSFNLFETLAEVPLDTTSQKKRWLIQSKFETPILNFAGSQMGASTVTSSVASSHTSSADEIVTRGMWHQYGTAITSSAAGIFINLSDSGPNSLADVVGFQKGIPRRLGVSRTELKLWEAIIAIPYHLGSGGPENSARGGPNFIAATARVKASPTYQLLLNAMDKYVFPPRFDFTRFDTVDPILMYVFEFSANLSQKDITDIWQNLPPDINEKFESKEAVVEEEQLLNLILDKDSDIHWMVFKVKKRAKKDFEITRRQLVQEDTSAMTPNIISEYSYNWPYDYFSLVELAKIDEQVQYVSRDLKPLPVITSTIGPELPDASNEAETAPQPDLPGQ